MEFYGHADLRGRVIGTLEVGTIARRTPDLAWNVLCNRCGTRTVEPHTRLMNGGRCRNANCGKQPTKASGTSGATIATVALGVRSSDSSGARQFERPYLEHEHRLQREQQEREAHSAATAEADRQYLERFRREHQRYAVHAHNVWGVEPENVVPLETWCQIPQSKRQEILDRVEKERDERKRPTSVA